MRTRHVYRILTAIVLALSSRASGPALAARAAAMAPAAATSSTEQPIIDPLHGRPFSIASPRSVDAAHLGPEAHPVPRPAALPFHRIPTARSAAARTAGVVSPVSQRSGAPSSAAGLAVLAQLSGLSEQGDIAQFGIDQLAEPPDDQVAVGPNHVMEMVNSEAAIWSKTGVLVVTLDLYQFYAVPNAYFFSDPRVLYDAISGRWFASGLAFNLQNDSEVFLAISATTDPSGIWMVYTVSANTSATLDDQPFIGTSDDKVVVSWNDFASDSSFQGQQTLVVQKSDMLSGKAPRSLLFGPDTSRSRLVPVQSLSSTGTEYLVYNRETAIGVIAVTGTPAQGSVHTSEQLLPIVPTDSSPPAPLQPGGQVTTEVDDRFLSAIWRNGMLSTGGNDGCVPSGDSAARTCLRLLQVLANASSVAVLQDFDVGVNGAALYYPALAEDASGDQYVSFTVSSATINPTAAVAIQPEGKVGTLMSMVPLQAGNSTYQGTRWGDYQGAAADPTSPGSIWVSGEYAGPPNSFNWATTVAHVAFTPPPTLGGAGFSLTLPPSGVHAFAWTGGNAQSGYRLLRTSSGNTTWLPTSGPLPPNATSYVDPSATPGEECYALVPISGQTVLGISDPLCAIAGVQAGTAPPTAFSVTLNQSAISTLRWTPPGGQSGYTLYILPVGSTSAPTQIALPASATSATNDTGNAVTCYVLVALAGTTSMGNTDALCAIPGVTTMGGATATFLPTTSTFGRPRIGVVPGVWRPLRRQRRQAERHNPAVLLHNSGARNKLPQLLSVP